MNKKRRKNRKAGRKDVGMDWQLNQDFAKLEKTNQIDQRVAINAEIPDYDKKLNQNFLFSFVHYKFGQCGLSILDNSNSKKLVKKLKIINETSSVDISKSKLIKDDVHNNSKYKALYKGLPPDIEIKEIDFSSSGRIFVYFVKRFVCVIAIKPNHLKV
ncbi:hypothetical protein KAI92_02135 [Candidatus Parcubacteria bacterium]|nr:hypothetical protein [Candidatus Parcubacteria bacterium]